MQPLLLHAHATGLNPIKLAMALEALRLPYTVKLWQFGDVPQNGVKGESFLKINENGRVPALEDPNNGVVLWESGAYLNYIRRVYDKNNLLGHAGDSEQDRVDELVSNENSLNRYSEQAYRCYEVLEGQLKRNDGCSVLPGKVTAVDYHFEPTWLYEMTARDEVQQAYVKIKGSTP